MKITKPFMARRGAVLVYSLYLMLMMMAVVSLAVDYGKVQVIKTELQRQADASARGAIQLYVSYGMSTAQSYLTVLPTINSVDYKSSFQTGTPTPYANVTGAESTKPVGTVVFGYWSGTAFVTTNPSNYPIAAKAIMYRNTANGNPVQLAFPIPTGLTLVKTTCDVVATAVAILPNPIVTSNKPIASTGDPWLAGMPSGSTASDDDTAPNQTPASITVVPGSTVTFSNITGLVNHASATAADGPTGQSGNDYWHHKDGSYPVTQGGGAENGIGDLVAPIDSMIGIFLNGNAPNSTANSSIANPAMRTYSTDTSKSGIYDLKVQQPFYIGDGKNTSGNAQTFIVPAGATRMYLGIMDGYEWNNNVGSFSIGSVTVQPPIQIVQ